MAVTDRRPGFLVYFELLDSLEEYTDAETGAFLRAVGEYARYGVVPDFDDRGLRGLWKQIQPKLDRDEQKYQKQCQDNRYNGYISAAKRKYRRDNPGMGEPKEGKDYLSKEDWIEQIDETTVNDRLTTVNDLEPTKTETVTITETITGTITGTRNETKAQTPTVAEKGSRGKNELHDVSKLQAEWVAAMREKKFETACTIDSQLYRMGYTIDKATGELCPR